MKVTRVSTATSLYWPHQAFAMFNAPAFVELVTRETVPPYMSPATTEEPAMSDWTSQAFRRRPRSTVAREHTVEPMKARPISRLSAWGTAGRSSLRAAASYGAMSQG